MVTKPATRVQFDFQIAEPNLQAIVVASVRAQAIEDDIARTKANFERYLEYVEYAEMTVTPELNFELPESAFRTRFSVYVRGYEAIAEMIGTPRHSASGIEKAHINIVFENVGTALSCFSKEINDTNDTVTVFTDSRVENVVVNLTHDLQNVSGTLHIIP